MKTYNEYKEMINKMTYENTTTQQLDDLTEEIANNDELTNDEYCDLYEMIVNIVRF